MGRPKVYGKRAATALRLPVELKERLEAAALERDVSQNLIAERAIERYLDSLPPVDEVLS